MREFAEPHFLTSHALLNHHPLREGGGGTANAGPTCSTSAEPHGSAGSAHRRRQFWIFPENVGRSVISNTNQSERSPLFRPVPASLQPIRGASWPGVSSEVSRIQQREKNLQHRPALENE